MENTNEERFRARVSAVKPHTYRVEKLQGLEWHKYVIHYIRYFDYTDITSFTNHLHGIFDLCLTNLSDRWMCKFGDGYVIFYIGDDEDKTLFDIFAAPRHGDYRGKKIWTKSCVTNHDIVRV